MIQAPAAATAAAKSLQSHPTLCDPIDDSLPGSLAGQEATVRSGHGTTVWFQIGKGVRQDCILSPAY